MRTIFSWNKTFEFPGWKEVTCYKTYGYDRFNWHKFSEAFEVFCILHDIKRRKLSFTSPSSAGSWYYSFKVKCSEDTLNELTKYLDNTLKNMGIE